MQPFGRRCCRPPSRLFLLLKQTRRRRRGVDVVVVKRFSSSSSPAVIGAVLFPSSSSLRGQQQHRCRYCSSDNSDNNNNNVDQKDEYRHRRRPPSPSPSKSTAVAVTTYKRLLVKTGTVEPRRIPLSVVDVHLRREQLPFCYFFEETLDETALTESLRKVLRRPDFSVAGGTICPGYLCIQCEPGDFVSVSFGTADTSLQRWHRNSNNDNNNNDGEEEEERPPRGHVHRSDKQHPTLLPLFDSLFDDEDEEVDINNSGDGGADDVGKKAAAGGSGSLAKIRVTYFDDGPGTAIGVNFSHALGDTASCVEFVASWGRQMRLDGDDEAMAATGEEGKTATKNTKKKSAAVVAAAFCTDRSRASLSGIMTPDLADLMGLSLPAVSNRGGSYLPDFVLDWWDGRDRALPVEIPLPAEDIHHHEYVRLAFPPKLLDRLKDIGMHSCSQDVGYPLSFVSTNDMVTAFGWLMKRKLSQNPGHGISMVVNLRGRSGIASGHFGNGITHVVASLPAASQEHSLEDGIDTLCRAAKSIRVALHLGLSDLPEALALSRMGRPGPAPSNSTDSFSTTSWGQFPLYKVRFGEQALSGFHGHPAHPLPVGRTFASVITPRPDGGFWYEMLLPADQADAARQMHADMAASCMAWTATHNHNE